MVGSAPHPTTTCKAFLKRFFASISKSIAENFSGSGFPVPTKVTHQAGAGYTLK